MHARGRGRKRHRIQAILPALALVILVLSAGCTGTTAPSPPGTAVPAGTGRPGTAWVAYPLADQGGRGNFSISGFAGSAVLVSVVSVSCPSCIPQLRRQVDEAGRLAVQGSGHILVVVLDLDPGPGPGFLDTYGNRDEFHGYSARSPEGMTQAIFDRFGPFSVDTTAVPVILVCPDGRDLLLPPGLKTAESLKAILAREC